MRAEHEAVIGATADMDDLERQITASVAAVEQWRRDFAQRKECEPGPIDERESRTMQGERRLQRVLRHKVAKARLARCDAQVRLGDFIGKSIGKPSVGECDERAPPRPAPASASRPALPARRRSSCSSSKRSQPLPSSASVESCRSV